MPMITSDHRVEVLARVPLFAAIGHRDLRRIAKRTDETQVRSGDHLCEQGDLGEWAFILVDVSAEVVVDGQHVATLPPGEICGELALLDGGPRAATVTVAGDGSVLLLPRTAFLELLSEVPELAAVVLGSLGQRLRTANAITVGALFAGG